MSVELKYKLKEKLHAEIVLGNDKSFPRGIAINMLLSSKLPNSVDLLQKVLNNNTEKPKYQRLAAVTLWRMNDVKTNDYLLKAAKDVKDPGVLTAVVKCLGRVGDQRALQLILDVEKRAKGVLKAQASFAMSLISHRLGLQGNNLSIPNEYLKMPSKSNQRIQFFAPLKGEVDMFTSSMSSEPYGIEISKDHQIQFSCPGGQWIIAFNQGIIGANVIKLLQQRKTFIGIIAAKNSEDGRYSVVYLVLTNPQAGGGKVNIFVNRVTGEPAWAGTTTSITSNQVNFAIQTDNRIGIVPIELNGVINANGKVEITTAVTAIRVPVTRHPLPHKPITI